MDEGRHGFFPKESGDQYRPPVRDMEAQPALSTVIGPQRSDGEVVQHGMRAAGQHKGRHHEKKQSRARRRILDPHVTISPVNEVLFYFGSVSNSRTKGDRIFLWQATCI
jgi:hypothetical protein